MKILTVWQGVAVVLTLGATVSAYLEHQKRDQRVQNDLVEGRLGVAIEIRNGQANTVVARQFVWKRDGHIVVTYSKQPGEEGVGKCDHQELDNDKAGLEETLNRDLKNLSLDDQIRLKTDLALVVAGRVVCNFEGFKNLKDLHAYGMRYKLTKPEMSQPGSP